MSKKTKILALVLTTVMLVCAIPFAAFANASVASTPVEVPTNPYYDRWTNEELVAAGATMLWDKNYNAAQYGNMSGNIAGQYGFTDYSHIANTPDWVASHAGTGYFVTDIIEEGGKTYYLFNGTSEKLASAELTKLPDGSGAEFTEGRLWYTDMPSQYIEILDDDGNSQGFKSEEIPTGMYGTPGFNYEFYFANAQALTANGANQIGNLTFRLSGGEGLDFDIRTALQFRYYKTATGSGNDGNRMDNYVGGIKMIDGEPHLLMSGDLYGGFNDKMNPEVYDCGILRDGIYTDITMSVYFKDVTTLTTNNNNAQAGVYNGATVAPDGNMDLVYDLYVNGVKMNGDKPILLRPNVSECKFTFFGMNFASTTQKYWLDPIMTWSNVQVYTGEKLNSNENPFTGVEKTREGAYIYENSVCKSFVSYADAVNLTGYSTTLGELLGMNFYASLPEGVKSARVTSPDGVFDYTVADMTPEADGTYKFTSEVSSINARAGVSVEFFDEDGKAVNIISDSAYGASYTTSVYTYAKELLADPSQTEATKNAAGALINYVAYAENYFTEKAGGKLDIAAAYTALNASALDAVTEIASNLRVTGDTAILGEVQLVLDNATKIKVYLNSAPETLEGSDNIKLIGGEYVEISGIDAKNLDSSYVFTVDGTTVSISATDIASHVIKSSDNADFVNLMKALYLYSKACNELAGA